MGTDTIFLQFDVNLTETLTVALNIKVTKWK